MKMCFSENLGSNMGHFTLLNNPARYSFICIPLLKICCFLLANIETSRHLESKFFKRELYLDNEPGRQLFIPIDDKLDHVLFKIFLSVSFGPGKRRPWHSLCARIRRTLRNLGGKTKNTEDDLKYQTKEK